MPAGARLHGYDSARLTRIMKDAYVLAEEVGDAARKMETNFGRFAALVLARACQSVHSANILSANGLIGDAMTVARTPVELAIDLAYIARDADARIGMFMDHDHVKKYELAQAIAELHEGDVDQSALAELKRRADEAMARNPSLAQKWTQGSSWSGVGVRARAKEGDRIQMYKLLYKDMCGASHSGYATLEYALVDLDGEPKIKYGNMEPDDAPAVLAAGALMALIGTVVDTCGLEAKLGERSTALVHALTRRDA